MPYPNEHAARLVEPDRFAPDSFRRENNKFGEGIHAIFGKLKGEDTMTLQAIHFDAGKFTAEEARKWLEEHDYRPIVFEEAAGKEKTEKFASNEELSYFIPLRKADEARREVWGVAAVEQPDQSGEIMDYEKSKPHFLEWSKRVEKASGGKSKGNVRDSHTAKAVGKVIRLLFDDVAKAIRVGVKILDEEAWQKVIEGVFTGFSIGGRYGERWPDPFDKSLIRYIAIPQEISLVDLPCIPGATFEMVKVDGSSYRHKFAIKGDTMKGKIQSILKKQLNGADEEKIADLAEQLAEILPSDIPEDKIEELAEQIAEVVEESPTSEGEERGAEEEPQDEEAVEQPKPLTPKDVREIVLAILEEIGLLEQVGGELRMGAKIGDLRKTVDGYKLQISELRKTVDGLKTQLVKDVARLAVEVEELSKRGGAGPVLREIGTLEARAGAALQQAEALRKALVNVADPMAAEALRNEIARLEIQAIHQKRE